MGEYEVTRALPAPAEIGYDVAAQVGRMEAWLPTAMDVEPAGPDGVHVEGETAHGRYSAEGRFAAKPEELRLEWGSKDGDDYSGWLAFTDSGAGTSEATMHLSFRGSQPQAADDGDPGERTRQEMDTALSRLADQVLRRTTDAS